MEPANGRTREPERRWRCLWLDADAELLQDVGGASGPLRHIAVAHVLKIRDAHLAGEEAARGQVAEAVEKGDAVLHPRRRLVRPGDIVEHLRPLGCGRGEEVLLEAARA